MLEQQVIYPPIRAVYMGIFPSYNSLNEVMALAFTKFPPEQHNLLYSVLMSYHNTLLKELNIS